MRKYPPIVRALQATGIFVIGWHLKLGPAAILLGGLWLILVEMAWDYRFPW